MSRRHFSGYRSILHGSNFIYKNITRNRVPTSNLRALEGKDPLTRVDAHTNELFERGVHRCVRVSGNCTGSRRNSPRKRAWHGWPLDFQVLRGFHKHFVFFLLRVHLAFTDGGLFWEWDNTGRVKNSIWEEEGSKEGSRLRVYELWNALGFFFGRQCACIQIVTVIERVRSYQH